MDGSAHGGAAKASCNTMQKRSSRERQNDMRRETKIEEQYGCQVPLWLPPHVSCLNAWSIAKPTRASEQQRIEMVVIKFITNQPFIFNPLRYCMQSI